MGTDAPPAAGLPKVAKLAAWFRRSKPGDSLDISETQYRSVGPLLHVANALVSDRQWRRGTDGPRRLIECVRAGK